MTNVNQKGILNELRRCNPDRDDIALIIGVLSEALVLCREITDTGVDLDPQIGINLIDSMILAAKNTPHEKILNDIAANLFKK